MSLPDNNKHLVGLWGSHMALWVRYGSYKLWVGWKEKWDVVAPWLRRWLSTRGSWVRFPLSPPRGDLGQVLYLQVACALWRETPIQYPCCSRERLWVVEDLKGRYRNGLNEWMKTVLCNCSLCQPGCIKVCVVCWCVRLMWVNLRETRWTLWKWGQKQLGLVSLPIWTHAMAGQPTLPPSIHSSIHPIRPFIHPGVFRYT